MRYVLIKVNDFFKEWDDIKKGRNKLEQVITQKTEEFTFEKDQKAEQKMYSDLGRLKDHRKNQETDSPQKSPMIIAVGLKSPNIENNSVNVFCPSS